MAKIAILVEKIYEDLELQYPRLRLKEAGHAVEIVGPKAGETYVGKHGYPQKAEKAAADVKAADYDLIVIPGGSSPDHMRRNEGMVRLVRDAAARKIPMAATTWSTRAGSGWTRSAWWTARSLPPAPPTTCRRSATRSCNWLVRERRRG
jgi:putative intracellular protease/amidase